MAAFAIGAVLLVRRIPASTSRTLAAWGYVGASEPGGVRACQAAWRQTIILGLTGRAYAAAPEGIGTGIEGMSDGTSFNDIPLIPDCRPYRIGAVIGCALTPIPPGRSV